ncbi:MAG: YibE/F family protein [Oscillospiraceae bacterium]|nr:YibE/F family protein [Oscillospiraceae bacterium]
MKKKTKGPGPAAWLRENKWTCVVLAAALAVLLAARLLAAPVPVQSDEPENRADYESASVDQILSDSTEKDPASDNGYRGEQLLLVTVHSGDYKGQQMQVYNYVGPLYGGPLKVGDRATVLISTYSDGTVNATVYEFDRLLPLCIVLVLFIAAAVAVGGRTGVKSLVALAVTLVCLFGVLLPSLMKGANTLLMTFIVCAYVAVVSLTIVGGVRKKTVCAMLGAVAGTALALLFGLLAQGLTRIDGLRIDDVEPLLQLRQTGTPIGLRGLLVGGIVISALGAVMDVTMGIASSLSEVHAANPELSRRELFRSGTNIGRDMVGTMTNTLILAFLGSGFTLILYLYSLGLSPRQLLSSAYVSLEVVSGVASSVGVILSIPLTALITAEVFTREKKSGKSA